MLSKNEIKSIQSLQDKKYRKATGLFVAEGVKWINELLLYKSNWLQAIYALPEWIDVHKDKLAHTHCTAIDSATLAKISGLQTPQQVLAVVRMWPTEFVPIPTQGWTIGIDAIQDPGNMGAIIRIADWFGISHVYCSTDCADCFSPKVVQASMGSLTRVQVCSGPLEEWVANAVVPVYATGMKGNSIFTKQNRLPGLLLLGNEGHGIRPQLLPFCKETLTIPGAGNTESLNAAVAAGIIVSHLVANSHADNG